MLLKQDSEIDIFHEFFLIFYSKDPFCRAYGIFFFWYLDTFLVFDREVLLCSFLKPAI